MRERGNRVTETIIGACIRVHRELGPGLLESAYEACLLFELTELGLAVERQKALPIRYRGVRVETGYRLDLVVENLVVALVALLLPPSPSPLSSLPLPLSVPSVVDLPFRVPEAPASPA